MKNMTEMLKGLLEGIILQIIAKGETYGYEITNQLVKMGFKDIAEGTVYTVLLRLEKQKILNVERRKSQKGPMRKFYTLNAAGQATLDDFWQRWHFLKNKMTEIEENNNEN
ncbi:PadR family transcriptional regulator [Loigolactobacillus jiayinensis]|uniref:PadR family transcriptional regulator n=1 Tax=Loigolactobacillus jiayinensis TaxID=2486016 RepID=A0ABW1RG95_9LACO|nr:PadR family transcriptional regulator [Loigolactobacillus jiayinensis]